MKLKLTLPILFSGLILAVIFSSCSKNEDSTPVQPADPELIGTWQGTTSQGQVMRVGVFNLDGLLIINTYKYDVLKWTSDTTYVMKSFDFNLSTIVTSVVDRYFAFTPSGAFTTSDYCKGTFDIANMKLSGQIRTSFPTSSGTSVDYVNVTYTCSKVADGPIVSD